ncbi:MAG: ABC transporter permease [Chloroflexi bacterium]|nr:ABC transporter permease [Chloroflexota bacterium]
MREAAGEARIVFSEELRRHIRRPSWLIITGLVPAILLILLIVVPIIRSLTDDDDEPKPIGYLDLSGELSEVDFPNLTRFDTRQGGIDAIVAGDIEDLFIVPADFLESGDAEWLSQRSGIFAGESNRNRFASFLTVSLIAERLDPSLLDRVIAGADYVRVHVGEDGSISPDDDDELNQFVVPLIFTILLMMSIFMGAGTLLESVSEEKENRMVDVLLTSVSPLSLMAGKILALGTTSLVQMIVWIASIAIIGPQIVDQIPNAGDLEIAPLTLAYVSLFFIAGYFLFSVILAGIGSATTSAKEAGPITAMVVFPAGIPLWLVNVILSAPDGGVARVLSFIPITAPTAMMLRIGSGDVSNAEILASLAVTALAGVVMLFISARVFRAGLLLYGQRMTLGAVWRAVRQAG